MSYFNEFAGGPKNGHKWLVNSNIDWGQDILMLKWWQDKHPEATLLNAAMFTMFDPADIGLKYQSPAPFLKGHPEVISKDGFRGPQQGWYAVSVCMLKGLHFDVPDGDGTWTSSTENFTYFLDNFEPVDMIGYSIYIYHITEEDATRVRAKLLAEEAEWLRKAESGERKGARDERCYCCPAAPSAGILGLRDSSGRCAREPPHLGKRGRWDAEIATGRNAHPTVLSPPKRGRRGGARVALSPLPRRTTRHVNTLANGGEG